jgi:lysyl-tRNA synthetase class 2
MREDLGGSARDEWRARLAKVEALRDEGIDPYPVHFARTDTCGALRERFADLEAGEETDEVVHVAGRMLLRRDQGKLCFATLRDGTGELQLFVSKRELGDAAFEAFGQLDLGDWVGASGTAMRTRVGELSVKVSSVELLAKALRPMPDKWHGISDVDTRFRQRYVDLIVNDEARRVFEIRGKVVQSMRDDLLGLGYREVETPVLQPLWGGATARPFTTHHNALDMELYLRIAPELYLKRLIVGGLDKVFEIGRVFRNEGLSTRHNPEFTMLELYEAFVDYHVIAARTEDLIASAAEAAIGTTKVEWGGYEIDLAPPMRRASIIELVREHAGVDMHPTMAVDDARAICERFEIPWQPSWGSGKLLLEVYEKTTEHAIVEPTFVMDYPREVSPLARVHRSDPALTERFELIIGGREVANAFSELNDPVDQRRRFEAQLRVEQVGDDLAQPIDDDYIRALEYGMPPCGGLGIGIDRVTQLIAGVTSIREVILFPHLRPEASS